MSVALVKLPSLFAEKLVAQEGRSETDWIENRTITNLKLDWNKLLEGNHNNYKNSSSPCTRYSVTKEGTNCTSPLILNTQKLMASTLVVWNNYKLILCTRI